MSHRLIAVAALFAALVGIVLMVVTATHLDANPRMGIYLAVQVACTVVCLFLAVMNWSLRR